MTARGTARAPGGRRAFLLTARAMVSVTLLFGLTIVLEPSHVVERLTDMRLEWVVAALAVSVAQVVGSAWRWRYTAGRLGLELPMARAVPEYYLATFLNQVLPGGVAGDVSRAWRHAREADARASVQAVAFERLSGLIVMSVVAGASALLLVGDVTARARAALLLLVAALIVWGIAAGVRLRARPGASRLVVDLRRALVEERALLVQLGTSAAVVGSYVLVFVMASRAVRLDASGLLLAMLAGPVLMTMLVPLTIAGWGLREAAAGALWSAAGMTASDGVAVAVAYGLLVLLSSLPGAVVLIVSLLRREGRDRRARPSPAERDAPPADEPDRG